MHLMKRSRKETLMWMYTIYAEVKAIYTFCKVKKEVKKVLNDLNNINWDEVVDRVNNNMNNVVSEQ